MVNSYRGLFEGWEIAVAKELIGRFRSRWRGLEREGFEDLLQECLLHWHGVRGQFDPKRDVAARAFMARVLRNKLMDVVRELESDRRKINQIADSLDQPLGDDAEGPSLLESMAAVTGDDAAASRLGADARIDLEVALARLTPAQQALCRLLGEEGLNVQEASRRLGVPRATLYDELKRIRTIFATLGLDDYLQR